MEFLSYTSRLRLIAPLLLGIATSCYAQEELGIRLKTTKPVLTATPNVCERDNTETFCTMSVGLIWEVPKAGHFCLHNTQTGELLQCWEDAYSGVYKQVFRSDSDTQYTLTRGINGAIAASTQINVVGAIEQQLRARRRSGFWRIF